jgi:hypothetical protein
MEGSFEDGVTHLMVMMEELKRSSGEDKVFQWQMEMDGIVGRLDFLLRKMMDDPNDDLKRDLFQHCRQRAIETCQHVLERTVGANPETKLVFDEEEEMQGQAVVARMTELCMLVHDMAPPQQDNSPEKAIAIAELIELYANYQKLVLRQRAKPAIVHLASWRKSDPQRRDQIVQDDDDEDAISQPHSHALTTALSQASALIHPLTMWKDNIPPESPVLALCIKSISVLDDQAQTLVKTISDWFQEDKKLDNWMQQTADNTRGTKVDLAALDALVDEMAFSCQVMARYTALMMTEGGTCKAISTELLPEWTWKYAALERFLGVQQLQSALQLAAPVNIVMGLSIKVPSVVEDAQYLSTRALDRATSTLNTQAMGTVAHSLSNDIWSTDLEGGVYQALLEQRGCWSEDMKDPTSTPNNSTMASPRSGDFASSLLDALDEDLKNDKTPPRSAPTSGGFLGSLNLIGGEMEKSRLETQLCAMNGIYSASTACQSLVESLDSWLHEHEESNSMISLAREELVRYSHSYSMLLERQVSDIIADWCGTLDQNRSSLKGKCLHSLRDFVVRENYHLDNAAFNIAEVDDRLEAGLIDPLNQSKLISQLNKCESEVGLAICKEFSKLVADLIADSLWQCEKRFTDWGSLLLSKQVRMLQNHVTGLLTEDATQQQRGVAPSSFLDKWERLSQIMNVLQLERPSDWSIYQATSILSVEELRRTMRMRVDFSPDAIAAVCQAQGSSS